MRARAFGMQIVAHDPFISAELAAQVGARLATLDEVCAEADYLTLHLPVDAADASPSSTPSGSRAARRASGSATRRAVSSSTAGRSGGARFAARSPAAARRRVRPGAADGLERWRSCPTWSPRHTSRRRPARRRSWSASRRRRPCATTCATASSGMPSTSRRWRRGLSRGCSPGSTLAERLGSLVAQMGEARVTGVGVRYYGELAAGRNDLLTSAVLVGIFRTMLSGGVTAVNAKSVAAERGIEVIESQSSRVRNFTSLRLGEAAHERRRALGRRHDLRARRPAPGAGGRRAGRSAARRARRSSSRTTTSRASSAPSGTVLGRHGVNIANFALGRGERRRDRRRDRGRGQRRVGRRARRTGGDSRRHIRRGGAARLRSFVASCRTTDGAAVVYGRRR